MRRMGHSRVDQWLNLKPGHPSPPQQRWSSSAVWRRGQLHRRQLSYLGAQSRPQRRLIPGREADLVPGRPSIFRGHGRTNRYRGAMVRCCPQTVLSVVERRRRWRLPRESKCPNAGRIRQWDAGQICSRLQVQRSGGGQRVVDGIYKKRLLENERVVMKNMISIRLRFYMQGGKRRIHSFICQLIPLG